MDLNYLMNFNPLQLLSFAGTQAFPSLVRGKIRVAPGIFSSSLTLCHNRVVRLILYFSFPSYFSKKSWVCLGFLLKWKMVFQGHTLGTRYGGCCWLCPCLQASSVDF